MEATVSQLKPNAIGMRAYVASFVALLVLATASLLMAGLPDRLALFVALSIALSKSLIVLFYFMHLREERFSYRFIMLVSSLLVCILIGLTVLDPITRAHPPGPSHNSSFEVARLSDAQLPIAPASTAGVRVRPSEAPAQPRPSVTPAHLSQP